MDNISEQILSAEEAKAALRCMRLSGLTEEEILESTEDFSDRVRKITSAALVEEIIENELSEVQRNFIKEYWYSGKNTSQIAAEYGVSQANVYKTLTRANGTIKSLMTPLIKYQRDLHDVRDITPLYSAELMEICAAKNSRAVSFCAKLRDLRVACALSREKLAQSLGISERELENIESGKALPSITSAMRYTALFGLEINMNFKNGRGTFECQKL